MMSPLNSRRYTDLVDGLNTTVHLVNEYLRLRIQQLKKEKQQCQEQ